MIGIIILQKLLFLAFNASLAPDAAALPGHPFVKRQSLIGVLVLAEDARHVVEGDEAVFVGAWQFVEEGLTAVRTAWAG